jgi:molybdate transport repressor ModE-like protein
MLDLNRLRVLQEVAAAGSFSAAARRLRVTPSAVSQQVAALERAVGVPVVDRSTRGVTLTDPGRMLTEVAENLSGGLSQLERHLAGWTGGQTGRLAVATFPSAGQSFLPAALAPLTARPEIDVTVVEAETDKAVPLLRAGEVDIALVYHFYGRSAPREWRQDLAYTPLLAEDMYAVVPAGHRLAGRRSVTAADLADEWWMHGTGDCAAHIDRFCAVGGFRPKVACRSGDYTFVQTLVAAGVGVGLVPAVAVSRHLDGIAVLPIDPAPVRYVGVLRRRGRWQPPLATQLMDLLQQTAAGLDAPGVTAAGKS